jgi:ribokinase
LALDLVCVGNLLVDDIVLPDGHTRMGESGGAILYTALGAVIWNARVGVASVAGSDYPAASLAALGARGVDLAGVRNLRKPGVRTWLLYEKGGRRVIHHLDRPAHDEVSPRPEHLPESFGDACAYHVSPMPLERQRALIETFSKNPDALVSLDPHESVREDNLDSWLGMLGSVDVFLPSEDDLKLEGVATDPRAAIKRLAGGRLRFVLFKRGPAGGLLYDHHKNRFIEWPGNDAAVVDGTGAGDAFAGGFLAGFVASGNLDLGLQQGAVSASFAAEDWGAHALLAATHEQAERRRHGWFGARAGR